MLIRAGKQKKQIEFELQNKYDGSDEEQISTQLDFVITELLEQRILVNADEHK